MKTLALALLLVFTGALCAQTYHAGRISNDYAGKTVYQSGVKLMANASVPWVGDLYDGYADDYPIGFNFNFYGQTDTTVDICINGWVSFAQLSGSTPWLPLMPSVQGPPASTGHDGAIAPCWFDMWGYVMSSSDGMFAQTLGSAPNREFRIDFHNMTKYGGPGGGTANFCLVLHETSNKIEIHYGNISAGTAFACGIENPAGNNGAASPDGWLLNAPATCGYTFTLDPELDIERGMAIANNGTDNAGPLTVGTPLALDYTAFNRGDGVLNLVGPGGNLAIIAQNNCTVNVVAAPPASIAAGASAVVTLSVTAGVPGSLDCPFEGISDDADESPYTITISGSANAAPAPEIELSHNGTAVASGGKVSAGQPEVGAAVPFVLRISNLGNGPLTLSGAPQVQVLNTLNCSVSVSTQPPATIAAGNHADVTLLVSALGAGAFSFSVAVASDDSDENHYTLNADGLGSTMLGQGGNSGGGAGCTAGGNGAACLALVLLALAFARRRARQAS